MDGFVLANSEKVLAIGNSIYGKVLAVGNNF